MPTYATPPAKRIEYDVDGALVTTRLNTNTPVVVSGQNTNDESGSTSHNTAISTSPGTLSTHTLAVAFPEPRTILGLFLVYTRTNSGNRQFTTDSTVYQTSTDTTDGVDGTWSAETAIGTNVETMGTEWRSGIVPVNFVGITGIRFIGRLAHEGTTSTDTKVWTTLHLYGDNVDPDSDGLEFWHPTLDQPASAGDLDFGDFAPGDVGVKQIRLHNGHPTLTANGITLSRSSPTSGMPMGPGLQFSADATTYADTLSIGDLAPGAESAVVYLRRTLGIPSAEPNGPNRARLTATATSWT